MPVDNWTKPASNQSGINKTKIGAYRQQLALLRRVQVHQNRPPDQHYELRPKHRGAEQPGQRSPIFCARPSG